MRKPGIWALLSCGLAGAAWGVDGPLHEAPAVRSFMAEVEARHGFDGAWLEEVFRGARRRQSILDAFGRPAEAKPWRAYRPLFVTGRQVRRGVEFARAEAAALERARVRYGVPPEIVAAIIGVESSYGRSTGRHRVIDALATLAFFAPRRSEFFRGELEQYLVLLREEGLAPDTLRGSYAGAIGIPQFISSSYRNYAIDFDGDGRRDLSGSVADAIGSVANYLARFGWRPGEPIAMPVLVSGAHGADALVGGLEPERTWRELEEAGLRPQGGAAAPAPDTPVSLYRLDGAAGPEYWAGFRNFYVITRYNRSSLYAMAVYQLADAIGSHGG